MVTAEQIDRITRFDPDGLPVVSMYVPVEAKKAGRRELRSRVDSLLHRIRPLGDDKSLDRDARLSVREDIERIATAAERENWNPGTVALFSCSRRDLFEEVFLPRPIRERVSVDGDPWVRGMLAVLDEYHRCCVPVVDKESAGVWELYLGEIEQVTRARGRALRKPDFGGWHGLAEHRVRNKADELEKRHFRRVAGRLDELFRSGAYELLAIGGHEEELPHFVEHLPRRLKDRVAGTFSVDPGTATSAEIQAKADEIVERYEREEERRMVSEVLDAAGAGGRAPLGLETCLWAGSVAAVQTLLVQEGEAAPGVVCDSCHWLGTSADSCPLCGGEVRQVPDVIDELAEAVIDASGSIEHVAADTELKRHLVAASLRFPLPPQPEPEA